MQPDKENPDELRTKYSHMAGLFQDHLDSLINKMSSVETVPQSVDESFKLMQSRMIHGMNTLNCLEVHSKHDHYHDSLAVLRVMYDLHLQFLYILTDPVKLSVQYCNHSHVEVHRQFDIYDKYPTKFADQLKLIPNWAMVKRKAVEEYDKVKDQYKTSKGTVRINWYSGNLADIAKIVGFEPEYRIMHVLLSSDIHSSAFSLRSKALPDISSSVDGWHLTMRVVGGIAKFKNVTFTQDEQYMYDQSLKSRW